MCRFVVRSFNGWCLSYIESLDTLWVMGLYEEFDGALAVVTNITFFMPAVSSPFLRYTHTTQNF